MEINITLKVVSAGRTIFEITEPPRLVEETSTTPSVEEMHYHEPFETVSLCYEVLYHQQFLDYVVPSITG